jgi:molecular chaperone GrpE
MTSTDEDKDQSNETLDSEKESSTNISSSQEIAALRRQLEAEMKRNDELSKRMVYLQADILNLQKQSDRKVIQARDDTKLAYLLELASIREDLERAISTFSPNLPSSASDGLRMVISKIDTSLKAETLEKIEVFADSKFDPHVHEAVAYSEADKKNDGKIISVVANGYMFKGKVIKPSLVEVARQKQRNNHEPELAESTSQNTGLDSEKKEEAKMKAVDKISSETSTK